MKQLKPLLLGLIFALVCNVSFAGHPPPVTDPTIDTKKDNLKEFTVAPFAESKIIISAVPDMDYLKIQVVAASQTKYINVATAADNWQTQVISARESNFAPLISSSYEKFNYYFDKPALTTDFRIRLISITTPTTYLKNKPIKIDKANYRNNKWKYHLYWQS
jgi:hypothetical protein